MAATDPRNPCNPQPADIRPVVISPSGFTSRLRRRVFGAERLRRSVAVITVVVLLVSLSGCIRRPSSPEGSQDYAMTVHLQAPPQERGPGGSCEIASRSAPDDPFALDAVFYLENRPGPGGGQTRMPPGVLDEQQRCRVTLSFLFVHPGADVYAVRTKYGSGWLLTQAEAFADPVIDVVERPPGNV